MIILHLEFLVCQLGRLLFEISALTRVLRQHSVLIVPHTRPVSFSSLLIDHALLFLLLLQVHLVPVHHGLIVVAPLLDLVSEFRMLLGNLDLFLQPLLFVVKLAEPVLEHLRLDLLLLHVQLLLELA